MYLESLLSSICMWAYAQDTPFLRYISSLDVFKRRVDQMSEMFEDYIEAKEWLNIPR